MKNKKSFKLCKTKVTQKLRPELTLTNIRHVPQKYIDRSIIPKSFMQLT